MPPDRGVCGDCGTAPGSRGAVADRRGRGLATHVFLTAPRRRAHSQGTGRPGTELCRPFSQGP